MGNWFAYITLALWPMISVALFLKKSVQTAVLWTLLGGFLLLPVGTSVDLPMIPALGKHTIPALSAFVGCRFVAHRRIDLLRIPGLLRGLFLLFMFSPFITAELNGDTFFVGGRVLQGMSHYDALSAIVAQFILISPFFLGRQFFRTYHDQLLLFKNLALSGLGYSILMLLEMRVSPQLHTWIYGYFPHSFLQQVRYGGYRPVVFIGHGLLVAFFTYTSANSACIAWQVKEKIHRYSSAKVTGYLLFLLVLCKSAGAIMYGFTAFFLIKFASIKTQLRVVTLLVSLALLYPTMSIMNIFPHQALLEWTASIDADRAGSMGVRFDNEHMLLEHGRNRFFFGWGSWGRNRVYNADTGKDDTVTDGRWVITFSQYGWLGFIAEFGLLALPVFKAVSASKLSRSKKEQAMLSGHAILICFIIIDQLPNASLSPWLWLLVGILQGRSEAITQIYRNEKRLATLQPKE